MNIETYQHRELGLWDMILLLLPLFYVVFLSFDYFCNIKKGKESWIKKIRRAVPLLVTLFIIFFIFEEFVKHYLSDTKALLASFVLTFILTIIHEWLLQLIETKKELSEIRNTISDKLSEFNNELTVLKENNNKIQTHPIIATKDDFKETVDNLFELEGIKQVAIDFAINSLKDISNKAFMQIDISFSKYTETLIKLLDGSKKSIIGTYTIRPKKIYENIINETDKDEKAKLIEYVNKFKTRNNLTRAIVFELSEINSILQDAISDMVANGRIKNIPEINWLQTQLSSPTNNKLIWSVTPGFLECLENSDFGNLKKIIVPEDYNYMTDFAIIDNKLLVVWRENHEKITRIELKGTLFMNWNKSVKDLSNKILDTQCRFIKNSFDDLLRFINSKSIPYYNNSDSKELDKFKQLYKELKAKLTNNYGWEKEWDNINEI